MTLGDLRQRQILFCLVLCKMRDESTLCLWTYRSESVEMENCNTGGRRDTLVIKCLSRYEVIDSKVYMEELSLEAQTLPLLQ